MGVWMSEPFDLPEPDVEYKLAAHILGKDDRLDRDILEALVGGPRRYSELKPLLGKRRDNVLTKALDRLRKNGTIRQLADLSGKSVAKSYALTQLGILVVFRLHEMVPVHEAIEAARRGKLGAA